MAQLEKHLSRFSIFLLMLFVAACETSPVSKTAITAASVGYLVIDQDTGEEVLQSNADMLFIPASTAKVPTSIAALEILGPNHRFETSLYATGRIVNEVLDGDLYLKGGGDPLLSIQNLMELTEQLRDLGLRQITGSFFYDDRFLTSSPEITKSQPETATYNPGISALSLDFNRAPSTTDDNLEDPMALPIKNPSYRTAKTFQRLTSMNDVTLPDPVAGTTPDHAVQLAKHYSPALYDILRAGLEFSNNLVSELIGASAARTLMKNPAPLAATSEALTAWLQHRLPNTDWRGFLLQNHSGLSAKSRMTPRQMVDMLRYAARKHFTGKFYRPLLPASGWRSSFRQRFRTSDVDARLWAKTGTMNYAKGLAGYFYSRSGRRCIFALFITDFAARQDFDANPRRLEAIPQENAAAWIAKAEELEETLIRKWIDQY